MPQGYYVYMYLDSKSMPYYIGKGKGNRWKVKHSCPVPKDINRIAIIQDGMTEDAAYALEEQLVEEYWSIVVNKNPGGAGYMPQMQMLGHEANRGAKRTSEQRLRMSRGQLNSPDHSTRGKKRTEFAEAMKGEGNPMHGVKHTPEAMQKIKNTVKNRPMISCVACRRELVANSIGRHWRTHEKF